MWKKKKSLRKNIVFTSINFITITRLRISLLCISQQYAQDILYHIRCLKLPPAHLLFSCVMQKYLWPNALCICPLLFSIFIWPCHKLDTMTWRTKKREICVSSRSRRSYYLCKHTGKYAYKYTNTLSLGVSLSHTQTHTCTRLIFHCVLPAIPCLFLSSN